MAYIIHTKGYPTPDRLSKTWGFWDPTVVTSLALNKNGSGGAPTVDGTVVEFAEDLSGNGHHLIAVPGEAAPQWQEDVSSLRAGATRYLRASASESSTDMTAVIGNFMRVASSNEMMLFGGAGGASFERDFGYDETATEFYVDAGGGNIDTTGQVMLLDTWYTIAVIFESSSSFSAWQNGSLLGTLNPLALENFKGFTLFGSSNLTAAESGRYECSGVCVLKAPTVYYNEVFAVNAYFDSVRPA